MKCKTCPTEFIPPRKNILNCSNVLLFKKQKNQPEGAAIREESESEQHDDEESESGQSDDEENQRYRTATTQIKSIFMW